MLKISNELFTHLQRLAQEGDVLEKCGVLWSDDSSDTVNLSTDYPGPLYRNRFRFDDIWWIKTLYEARARRKKLRAYYHTHPGAEKDLRLSRADIDGHPPGSLILILGNGGQTPRLFGLSFHKRCEEIPFLVVDSQPKGD